MNNLKICFLILVTTIGVNCFKLESRIYNGANASVGDYPYQTLLTIKKTDGNTYICGASLITDRCLLTAAHCVLNLVSATAKMGALSYKNINEPDSVTYPVNYCTMHPDYTKSTSCDLAVCRLANKVKVDKTANIKLVPLAPDDNNTYEGRNLVAAGWGLEGPLATGPSATLKCGDVVGIGEEESRSVYGSNMNSGLICAKGKNYESTCKGDSGGSLSAEPYYTLVGITSFGAASGCDLGLPCCFTRVTYFLDWIWKQTGLNPS